MGNIFIKAKEKFCISKEEFIEPYKKQVDNDEIIAISMRSKGSTEEEINDYLEMINDF
jgi:hypothetical protein